MLEANNDGYESDNNGEEVGIGFGAADMYDVTELLEMGTEVAEEDEDDPNKVMNSLKHGCVAESSQKAYTMSLVTFIIYIYKFERHLLHNSWIKSIFGVKDEKIITQEMRTIKALLSKADESCPPINLKEYSAKHFIKYLLSLSSPKRRGGGALDYHRHHIVTRGLPYSTCSECML